ncbi:hypothetical protein IFR05_001093 [Cadophora sp. M221]|nr:hypothetical protein IFR05_001093 [Cadophora sp. M221]
MATLLHSTQLQLPPGFLCLRTISFLMLGTAVEGAGIPFEMEGDVLSLEVLFDASRSSNEVENAPDRVDIVAVPGLGAGSQPWLEDKVNWLGDEAMLPYWVPTARIIGVTFRSTLLDQDKTIQYGLPSLASELLRAVMAKRLNCPRRPLIFIGHSFGGLIVKQAALLCEVNHGEFPLLASSLAGIVFLGTPHRGTSAPTGSVPASLAAVAAASGCGTHDQLQTAFEKENGPLASLAWEFARLAVVHHVPLFCFFEHPVDGKVLVDEHSATVAGFPSAPLTVDHLHLCKFASLNDQNYALVRDELLAITQGAASCVANRTRFPTDEVDKCFKALFITDPADDVETIEHTKGRLLHGSGSWLQADPAFREWLDCKASRILWLNGDPGKGKTMLAISVLKSINEQIRASSSGPSVLLAYFFCDNKDNRRNNAIAVLRGLIYQLLHARPDLSSQFRALFSREGDHLFSSPTAIRSLWRIMKEFFASPSIHRVYIVIDALDELDEESTDDFLKILGPLLELEGHNQRIHQYTDQADNCEVKWLLTSRNVRSISAVLCQTLNISLEDNTDHVQKLVSKFIDLTVDNLREQKGYTNTLTSTVAKTLEEISEGTFLYVSMACNALSRPNVRLFDTNKVLRTFPKGLEPLYERMVRQIDTAADEEHVGYAKAILRAMVLAVRSLTLHELAMIAGLPKEHHNDTNMVLEYTALCGSFITHRQSTVYFVHESVKEYLSSIDNIFARSIQDHHADLVHLFLAMIMDLDETMYDKSEDPFVLAYPRLFWMEHAKRAEISIDWTHYLSMPSFTQNLMSREKWLDFYWREHHADWDKQPQNFSPLHLAAYSGVGSLVKALVARGDPLDATDSDGLTPLMWATKNDHPDAVELLLQLGANHGVEAPGGLTAVFHAAINGRYRALSKLVEGKALVRATDKRSRTPLHYAAAYGNIKTTGVLLSSGAEIDAKDIGRHTALQQASIHGEVAIMSVLVAHNADISAKDKEGRTLLHLAARTSDLNVLDFWLKYSNDLETTDDQSWTPLMHAAMLGNDKGVAQLIKKGAQIETRTIDGQTALSLAIVNTRIVAVKALLDGGADPNNDCAVNETPLLQAAWLGNVAIVQSLLEAGAAANAETTATLKPLHQAAANGHEICSKLLLRYGADPNVLDSSGKTPAARAEENKHHSLARYLKNREISGEDHDPLGPGTENRQPLDPAVCELLKISPECGFMELVGEEGFSRPAKVTALVNGKATYYFMKSGPNEDMFASEHEALKELLETVPTLCPYSLGHGKYTDNPGYFLLMEWMDTVSNDETIVEGGSCLSLPQKLAKLHSTPAKVPEGEMDPMFGWPRSTYCGSTKQINTFQASWPKFFARSRLLGILNMIEETHGTDQELKAGLKGIVDLVVPRLLGNGHLGGRRGITPVLVHGDLWYGNKAYGVNPAWGGAEHVLFDPSAAYCHSEYEIGIMRAFGGFTAGFFHEYHSILPKTEPIHEYEDRIELYKLYHYLNHYLIFRGAYKDNAMDVIKRLADKYIMPSDGGLSAIRLL